MSCSIFQALFGISLHPYESSRSARSPTMSDPSARPDLTFKKAVGAHGGENDKCDFTDQCVYVVENREVNSKHGT